MKKLTELVNPFILLLVPVMFAVVMGISYQFQQQMHNAAAGIQASEQSVPLFYKGVNLFKAICAVKQENVW